MNTIRHMSKGLWLGFSMSAEDEIRILGDTKFDNNDLYWSLIEMGNDGLTRCWGIFDDIIDHDTYGTMIIDGVDMI